MGDTSTSLTLDDAIARLRQLTQQDRQQDWRVSFEDGDVSRQCDPKRWQSWSAADLNERRHIAWPSGRQVMWLGQVIKMPSALAEYPLTGARVRLALTWWAEQAEVYINGQLVQEGDLFDTSARVLLAEALVPGVAIAVAVRLVSPAHDAGALGRSRLLCEFLSRDDSPLQRVDPGLLADELEVLKTYVAAFRPDDLDVMGKAVQAIGWEQCSNLEVFNPSLLLLREAFTSWHDWIQERCIHWIGHAHLDLAWLWPVAETWVAAERTFKSVLNLQKDFDDLKFCHSTPALYAWVETHRPELFTQIQQRVREGRWEIAAGMWIEPELNMISGESLVRQVLYGQRYTQERFGQLSRVAWLPDSFGFCGQLPQILKQGGVDYFLTQKLRWNDTTLFPHEAFWWQSPDGTRIFSVMTPPIGESIDPVKMGTYAQDWEAKTGCSDSFWLPGVGDHGGGPTRDMVEVAQRLGQSQLLPKLKPSSMTTFCQRIEATIQDVPVWEDELYLEFHRGCYTSHADQKRYNRCCEHLLSEAELFSAIATLLTHTSYPKAELEETWKKVLFNQFHDILPGSSIPEVFVDANQDWELAQQTALALRERGLEMIADQIQLPNPPASNALPIIVFNSLNWERSEVVHWQAPDQNQGTILDSDGQILPTQYNAQAEDLSFWADSIPSVGYRIFWYIPTAIPTVISMQKGWVLENDYLRVEICRDTGNIASIWDHAAQREVLSGPGNVLQFFQDQGQYWDAWNIDPSYAQHPLEAAETPSVALTFDAVEQFIRMERHWRSSTFTQVYRLASNSPVLKIETQVDWQETHVLVKAAFPLSFSADYATYETPCSAIERSTLPSTQPLTEHQKAKWEVPALHWADLSQPAENYGVSLLNDCKYGYDAQPNCLRLTLLRSPAWPDPDCDRGLHEFTYAVYPHAGSWQEAQTVQQGYSLNRPLIARTLDMTQAATATTDRHSFLTTSDQNLILMALKQVEDNAESWILRCYESCGQFASGMFQTTLPLQYQTLTDGLEHPMEGEPRIKPWQIQSQQWS